MNEGGEGVEEAVRVSSLRNKRKPRVVSGLVPACQPVSQSDFRFLRPRKEKGEKTAKDNTVRTLTHNPTNNHAMTEKMSREE